MPGLDFGALLEAGKKKSNLEHGLESCETGVAPGDCVLNRCNPAWGRSHLQSPGGFFSCVYLWVV